MTDMLINTIGYGPVSISGAKRLQDMDRARITAMFDRMATPVARANFTPQDVMSAAAVACGYIVTNQDLDGDVLVIANWNVSWGFRICSDGELWLCTSSGLLPE